MRGGLGQWPRSVRGRTIVTMRGDRALVLPFIWIGLVGAWVLATRGGYDANGETFLDLLGLTSVAAGVLGQLAGSRLFSPGARAVMLALGSIVAGVVVGAVSMVAEARPWNGTACDLALRGAIQGAFCGPCFLPAVLPAVVAAYGAHRARPGSLMREADGRAACVLAVGMTAVGVGFFADAVGGGLPARVVGWAAVIVGLTAAVGDLRDLLVIRVESRRPGRVDAEAHVMTAPDAKVLDLGLGDERSEVVHPASVAYRDAPKRSATLVGDPKTVMGTIALALFRDLAVVGVGVVFSVLPIRLFSAPVPVVPPGSPPREPVAAASPEGAPERDVEGLQVPSGSAVEGAAARARPTGSCRSGLATLASGMYSPGSIALHGSDVYWSDGLDGSIRSMPKCGGGVTVWTQPRQVGRDARGLGRDAPLGLAVDSDAIYWNTSDRVLRLPLSGGEVQTLASGLNSLKELILRGDNLYVSRAPIPARRDRRGAASAEGVILRIPTRPGTVTTLATSRFVASGLTVDEEFAYWSLDETADFSDISAAILKVPLAGGVTTTLASRQEEPLGMFVTDSSLYWVNCGRDCGEVTRNGSLVRLDLRGGSPTTLAAHQRSPGDVVVHGNDVYWSSAPGSEGSGSILHASLLGGSPTTLADRQNPAGLAADESGLYWTNGIFHSSDRGPEGTLMRWTP